jgi:hypothetical protein
VTRDFGVDYIERRTCGRNSVLKGPGRVLNTGMIPITEGGVGVGEICFLINLGVLREKACRADLSGKKSAARGCIRGLGGSNLK